MSLPDDLALLERGFAHGACLLVHGTEPGLIDTGYHDGVAVLDGWLADQGVPDPPTVLLTHAHSDHSGGAHALQARGARVLAHPAVATLVETWDTEGLWLDVTQQRLPWFEVDDLVRPGGEVRLGERTWLAIEAGGHATGGLAFLSGSVLVTGDALWEDGFGLLDPWVDGPQVFDEAAAALDALEATGASLVIPGHGPPFTDLAGAIERARSRLVYLRDNPDRLREQVVRNGVGFWRLHHPGADATEVTRMETAMRRVHVGPWD